MSSSERTDITHLWRNVPDPLGYVIELGIWLSVINGALRILLYILEHA